MVRSVASLLILGLGLAACSQALLGPAGSATDILITPTQDVFRWGDGENGGLTVEATVSNTGARAYYSRLGDGFNTADEQELLYVAAGSSAWLERREGSTWVSVERPFLIEGTKVITLNSGAAYRLVMTLSNDRPTGTFRFRVTVGVNADGTGIQSESVSAAFRIE